MSWFGSGYVGAFGPTEDKSLERIPLVPSIHNRGHPEAFRKPDWFGRARLSASRTLSNH
jgi:hypothetical protein